MAELVSLFFILVANKIGEVHCNYFNLDITTIVTLFKQFFLIGENNILSFFNCLLLSMLPSCFGDRSLLHLPRCTPSTTPAAKLVLSTLPATSRRFSFPQLRAFIYPEGR